MYNVENDGSQTNIFHFQAASLDSTPNIPHSVTACKARRSMWTASNTQVAAAVLLWVLPVPLRHHPSAA